MPGSYHSILLKLKIAPVPSVVLLTWIPPSAPVRLFPFLSSITLSSTTKVVVSKTVWVPCTSRSPLIVTVVPSSLILPFANWLLALSQTGILLSIKLLAFLIENVLLLRLRPSPAVKDAPVSLFKESISISIWPLLFVVCLIVVAPACLNTKSPACGAIGLPLLSLPSLVTVFVSVLSISIVFPFWDTVTFPPSEVPPAMVMSDCVVPPEAGT